LAEQTKLLRSTIPEDSSQEPSPSVYVWIDEKKAVALVNLELAEVKSVYSAFEWLDTLIVVAVQLYSKAIMQTLVNKKVE
jgi:hypothetical protein